MHAPAALVFLALCALWPWLLYRTGGGDLLNGFLVDSLFARFFPPAKGHVKTGHQEAFWYYFANFPASIMPWLIAVPAICHWFWRKRLPQAWNRSALVFLAWVFPIGLLMLSAAGTKRGLYLLPLVAPFGAVAGAWFASVVKDEQPHAIDRVTVSILLVLCVLVAFAALFGAIGLEIGAALSDAGRRADGAPNPARGPHPVLVHRRLLPLALILRKPPPAGAAGRAWPPWSSGWPSA